MINEFLKASSLIFMAEMGDKTQIIAMTFATQYMVRHVLSGVALGVIANHGIAIILGALIGNMITVELVDVIAGGLFIFFGWNALRIDDPEDIENKIQIHPIWTVALAFFIGELGDKTQLTAMALSAESDFPAIILAGTTLGMVATSGLGIFVGSRIGRKIPEIGLKIASSIVFLGFGISRLVGVMDIYFYSWLIIIGIIATIVLVELFLIRKALVVSRTQPERLHVKKAAEQLYEMTKRINERIEDICLGEEKCGTCAGAGCLLGYIKIILTSARENQDYYFESDIVLENLLRRQYNRRDVEDALLLTLQELVKYGWTDEPNFIMTKTRESLEILVFERKIISTGLLNNYLAEIKSFDYPIGKRYSKVLQGEVANEKKDN
ncbi:TMEM165/GDT1 family protein [Gudongella sp. DL1XJH-153]|uniref:TMEM165/GDT1 family protein n=1 Tax=Gudongella sp. DL1XJH-153 TaxID=3409804 RepID=UPI003BB74C0E